MRRFVLPFRLFVQERETQPQGESSKSAQYKGKKMENTIVNTQSTLDASNAASKKTQVGLMGLLAVFLCSLTVPASAAHSWTLVDTSPANEKMTGIRTGTTQMFAHTSSGDCYQYDKTTNTLELVTTSPAMGEITVGVGDSFFGRDTSNNPYQYNFKTKAFDFIPGTPIMSIGAGAEGVWGVDSSDGEVYAYNSTTNTFDPPPHGEPSEFFESISVGNYGIGPWGLDKGGHAWLYNTNTRFFDETDGVLNTIAVGTGQVWGITSSNTVWMYDPGTEKWIQPDTSARLVEISAGTDSNIWGVDASGEVYKFNDNPKILRFQLVSPQPPEAASVIRVSSGGAGIFVLSTSGSVYKYH